MTTAIGNRQGNRCCQCTECPPTAKYTPTDPCPASGTHNEAAHEMNPKMMAIQNVVIVFHATHLKKRHPALPAAIVSRKSHVTHSPIFSTVGHFVAASPAPSASMRKTCRKTSGYVGSRQKRSGKKRRNDAPKCAPARTSQSPFAYRNDDVIHA